MGLLLWNGGHSRIGAAGTESGCASARPRNDSLRSSRNGAAILEV
jgi:hypothetical protein